MSCYQRHAHARVSDDLRTSLRAAGGRLGRALAERWPSVGRLAGGLTGCCATVDALISMMNAVKDAARARGRDADRPQFVMRCIVTRTDRPVEDANRPVAVGSWDQIRDDAPRLADTGVDETFFDVAFQPDVADLKSYLSSS